MSATLPVEQDGLHQPSRCRAPRRRAGAGALHPTVRRRLQRGSARSQSPRVEAGLDPGVFVRVHRCPAHRQSRSGVLAEECRGRRGRGDDGAYALPRPGQPLAPALAEAAAGGKAASGRVIQHACCAAARRVGLRGHTSVITGNLPPSAPARADAVRSKNLRSCAGPLACACRRCCARASSHPRFLEPVPRRRETEEECPVIPGPVTYHRPSSLTDAVTLLAALGDDARPLAGGAQPHPDEWSCAWPRRSTLSTLPASPS